MTVPIRPVFVLGPGRGGTTLLYKLLCLHRDVGFISTYDTRHFMQRFTGIALRASRIHPLIRRRSWFSATGQAYSFKRHLLQRLVPTPTEGEKVFRDSGLTLDEYREQADGRTCEVLRNQLERIQNRHRAQVLVVKRTANNRRIPALEAAFPEARYVMIWRDGRAVAASLCEVNWWLNHGVWWADNRTPRQIARNREEMLEIAARNWVEEAAAIERGLKRVDPGRVLTIRYENLLADPDTAISAVLRFAGLDVLPNYLRALRSIGLRPSTERWRSRLSAQEVHAVERIQAQWLQKLAYTARRTRPETAASL